MMKWGTTILSWLILVYLIWTIIVVPNMPVVLLMQAQDWQRHDNEISAKITGWKIRSCIFAARTETAYLDYRGVWEKSGFRFGEGDPDPESTHPTGFQRFGVYIWINVSSGMFPSKALLYVQHLCGNQVIYSIEGPFTIPAELAKND